MLIQYYGDFCFKITTKPGGRATEDVVLWTDPVSKESGLRAVQGQADIILLSHDTTDKDRLSSLRGDFIVFDAPGEYASHGFTLRGIAAARDTEAGALKGQNTIFSFAVEDLTLCFLGALGHPLVPEQLKHLDHVDILFIPIGNTDTLSIRMTDELIRKIEPSLIIPMHYKIEGLKLAIADEKTFCDEIGNCPGEKLPKINIKKKDLEGKSMEIVFLDKA